MRAIEAPIPVTVITGFLGAGKTTLLNRLLKDPALADTAVIVNEFGEVAIDHMLVESASDGVIELSDGCLCCTVRGDLVDTLADLLDRLQTGRIGRLRRVVVETTGLADPVPVLLSLMAHPAIVDAYRLDGVVTVVDAVNGAATLDRHQEAVRQVAVADRLVMGKPDLAEPEDLLALRTRLSALNRGAPVVSAEGGVAELLDCGLYDPATKAPDVDRWLRDEAEREPHDGAHHDHDHHGPGHHSHGHHGDARDAHQHRRHDDRVRTFSLRLDRAIPLAAVEGFLDLLRATQGENLLRMKGVIETVDDPERPLVIHGVQKILHPPARLQRWPEGPRGARLVIIGSDLPEDYVRRLFAAFAGEARIDTPDRAAMADNPLAVAGFRF